MSLLDLRPSPPSARPDAPVRWSTYSRQPLIMAWPVLVCLSLMLLIPGLIGRELWRGDDAEQFGVIVQLLQGGSWLVPYFQEAPWHTEPLYYWVNAMIAQPLSLVLSLPDAARVGNLFWVAITLFALHKTIQTTDDTENARVLPFLALAAPGLMLSAHEIQPELAVMAGYATFFWGANRICFERVMPGSGLAALGVGMTLLAGGLPITLPLITILFIQLLTRPRLRANTFIAMMLGLLLGFSWFIHAAAFGGASLDPDILLEAIWPSPSLHNASEIPTQLLGYFKLLAWSTWPAWPIALWTLWRRRLTFWQRSNLIPLAVFCLTLGIEIWMNPVLPARSLPLLMPIVLLAAASVTHLRRGAANLLDAFTLTLFTLTAGFVWLGWTAIHFGWPQSLAAAVTRLEPGFETQLTLLPPAIAFLLTVGWFVLMRNIPRSPVRGIQHWFAGTTLIWALVVALWSPWLDHGMTYTRLGTQIASQLNEPGCIATYSVKDDARAALSYQLHRELPRTTSATANNCRWLLTESAGNAPDSKRPKNWESASKVWSGHRRGTRAEKYTLYLRPTI